MVLQEVSVCSSLEEAELLGWVMFTAKAGTKFFHLLLVLTWISSGIFRQNSVLALNTANQFSDILFSWRADTNGVGYIMVTCEWRLQHPWLWGFQKIVTNSQLPTAKMPGRKFSSYTCKPDISDWNPPLFCISLKRDGDGCGIDLSCSDSKTNISLIFLALTFPYKHIFLFLLIVCPSVLFHWHPRGKLAQKVQKTSYPCLWGVGSYPVELSCLCSCTLPGGAKQLQWYGETDQRTSSL